MTDPRTAPMQYAYTLTTGQTFRLPGESDIRTVVGHTPGAAEVQRSIRDDNGDTHTPGTVVERIDLTRDPVYPDEITCNCDAPFTYCTHGLAL